MKKITLLIVVIILVIGIQGCSTEDQVIEVEKIGNLPENAISADEILAANGFSRNGLKSLGTPEVACFQKVFVLYPSDWSPNDRLKFLNYTLGYFNPIMVEVDDCENVDTWFLPCDTDIPGPGDKEKDLIEITEIGNGNENDEEHPDEANIFRGWSLIHIDYSHCYEVPSAIRNGNEDEENDNDSNEDISNDLGIH